MSAHTRHRLGRTIRATHKFHQRGLLKRAHHAVMAVLGTPLARQASGAVTVAGSRACLTKISGVVVDAGEMSRFQLLSDAQWSLIADLLPARTGKQGRPFVMPARSDHSLCDQTVIWPTAADRRFGTWLVVWSAAVTTAFDSPGITIETVLCRR